VNFCRIRVVTFKSSNLTWQHLNAFWFDYDSRRIGTTPRILLASTISEWSAAKAGDYAERYHKK